MVQRKRKGPSRRELSFGQSNWYRCSFLPVRTVASNFLLVKIPRDSRIPAITTPENLTSSSGLHHSIRSSRTSDFRFQFCSPPCGTSPVASHCCLVLAKSINPFAIKQIQTPSAKHPTAPPTFRKPQLATPFPATLTSCPAATPFPATHTKNKGGGASDG
jgi:hypothetical protein